MSSQIRSKRPEVIISKGDNPKESLLKGIEQLGGIGNFIGQDDQVFIKFNLTLPGGFPTNTNFDVLKELILSCKEAGAEKIYIGSFPIRGIPIKVISDLLNLEEYFKNLGASLVFLDNSDIYEKKEIDLDKLKSVKNVSFSPVEINGNEFFVPNIIINSDKFICLNQINVNPLFTLNLSLINLYSIIPPKYRIMEKGVNENISIDQYKQNLISNILDAYAIKRPNLVINDLFFTLEGAGPYIYKDSRIKTTKLMIIGDNLIAVDKVTLKVLNFDEKNNDLIIAANKRIIEAPEFSDIKILGNKIEDVQTNIEQCVSELKDIRVKNFTINSGNYCSGCFKQAYHLLNFMKTYMGKDLKYNPKNSFLIGENPPEPSKANNYLIFGDCAINSTKNYEFHKIIIESKKNILQEAKGKLLKESKSNKKPKVKVKQNKNILKLPGCAPSFFNCLELILKYYGKKEVPNLNIFTAINRFWYNGELNNKLNLWEAL
ncbi:MAG: DUF362 domain-containing protein [Candidatus Hermodarchaeota archaeon]